MFNDETERVLDRTEGDRAGTASDAPADTAQPAETATLRTDETEDDLTRLQRELDAAREEAAQFRNKYLRAAADMENYRKSVDRTATERERTFRRNVFARFLPAIDNLERTL